LHRQLSSALEVSFRRSVAQQERARGRARG
jgi:hypothetical protein